MILKSRSKKVPFFLGLHPVPLHESLVKLGETIDDIFELVLGRKNSRSEMKSSWDLLETTARNCGNSSLLKQLQAIHDIGCFSFSLRCFNRGGRNGDPRERVHRSVRFLTHHPLEGIESIRHHTSSLLQALDQLALLSVVLCMAVRPR